MGCRSLGGTATRAAHRQRRIPKPLARCHLGGTPHHHQHHRRACRRPRNQGHLQLAGSQTATAHSRKHLHRAVCRRHSGESEILTIHRHSGGSLNNNPQRPIAGCCGLLFPDVTCRGLTWRGSTSPCPQAGRLAATEARGPRRSTAMRRGRRSTSCRPFA